jgi:N-alpha-acetyltransferase 50
MRSLNEGKASGQAPPQELEIESVGPEEVDMIESINLRIFPIKYSKKFYSSLFEENVFTYMVSLERSPIGIASYRAILPLEEPPVQSISQVTCSECPNEKTGYIILLGLLEEERGRGIGRKVMEFIMEHAKGQRVTHLMLHVQLSNLVALKFYTSHGFSVVKCMKNYYVNVQPRDAFLLRKCLDRESR